MYGRHGQQVQQRYSEYDQQQCGARSSGVSTSTADPHRAPNQRPVEEGQDYSDPLGDRKVVITHAELTNEKVKPVLQTGEALSDARAFPLINAAGQQTGLNLEIIWLLHYWAQNNQGVLIELGDPNNVTTFSESEIYHSLCALVKKKGYDSKDVMSLDMPTGSMTGPAGKHPSLER